MSDSIPIHEASPPDAFAEDERPTSPATPAAKRLRELVLCPACGGPEDGRLVHCLLCADKGYVTFDDAQAAKAAREARLREFPATKTPVSRFQMHAAMRDAWTALAGAPSPEALSILLAHWAHETGTGKSMMNFNVGNWKAPRPLDQDHCYFATQEVLSPAAADREVAAVKDKPGTPCHIIGRTSGGNVRVLFEPRHPTCRFRSFPTLGVGCDTYTKGIRVSWPAAWDAAVRGSTYDFAAALKKAGYYTADIADYTAAIAAHYKLFLPFCDPLPDPGSFGSWSAREVQHVLARFGFDPGPLDGVWGNGTKAAAIAFQNDAGLPPTGLDDLDTRRQLGNRLVSVDRPPNTPIA